MKFIYFSLSGKLWFQWNRVLKWKACKTCGGASLQEIRQVKYAFNFFCKARVSKGLEKVQYSIFPSHLSFVYMPIKLSFAGFWLIAIHIVLILFFLLLTLTCTLYTSHYSSRAMKLVLMNIMYRCTIH